jgi:hypothetical protein
MVRQAVVDSGFELRSVSMKIFRSLMLVTMVATLVTAHSRAEEPVKKKEAAKDEISSDKVVAEIAFAGELTALGRGEVQKGFQSPEALVLAGGVLLRADASLAGKMDELDVKPTDAKGKPVEGDTKASPKLTQVASDLFEEARGMVAGDAARAKGLETLIKQAQTFEARGTLRGPKNITRTLNGGQTHTYNFTFAGRQQAAVAMTSSGPARIHFDLSHTGGASVFNLKGMNANYSWMPGNDKDGVKHFTVTLTNMGNKPTTYTLTTN